jgi:hypothetical protein
MAVCALSHADAFSHPVEGYIDWQYAAILKDRVSDFELSMCFAIEPGCAPSTV